MAPHTRPPFCLRTHGCRSFVALAGLLVWAAAAPAGPVVRLAFDGDLRDASGQGNDASAPGATYVPGQRGQALKPGPEGLAISDRADLRLAPGLRLDCWIRFDGEPADHYFLVKDNEYMLRVDPANEGAHFAFFAYLDGWEPRVRSSVAPKPGVWYHLVAGWTGQELTLEVNGTTTRNARTGTPTPGDGALRVNHFEGAIDELQIDNPGAQRTGVAHWGFNGDLRDDSGHGHDLTAPEAKFVDGRQGQALAPAPAGSVPSHPDLQLAAGLCLDCSVYFEKLPPSYGYIAIKEGEYQLRVDSPQEGGHFAFFVNLNGGWEPRVRSQVKAEPGVWYRVRAKWDGMSLSLDVNGQSETMTRSGVPKPGAAPLKIGLPEARIDDLRIENPRLPVLRVQALTQEHSLLRAGTPERLTATIENIGPEVREGQVELALGRGVTCQEATVVPLGVLPAATTKTVSWTVRAAEAVSAQGLVKLTAAGVKARGYQRWLAFLPAVDQPLLQPVFGAAGTTWYIDGLAGDNARQGTSPATAWRDFTPVNGKVLGPGDKLLIKRGSVFNQELRVSAKGTATNWAEIGAYGTGPRPMIKRNWDIDERCALITNPDYLLVGSLTACYAGKGLVVTYTQGGHQGLIVQDCIAHHIEGLYRFNSHGIPEWRDKRGAPGDGLGSSAGIAIMGAPAKDLVLRDSEVFQCSWGFFAIGEAVTVDRVFCHDNYCHNTCPHPAMVGIRRSYLTNSIFDAPGWHAYAGTMGIMLCDPESFVVRNCTFRNQPDSKSHDEGGIDFENNGNGCLVDHCTFENNAGAAIEVLGLQSPQPRNVEIANSRFIRNNTARKLGPGEIFIWGPAGADVCCSTGTVHDCGYVLLPGVEFFSNKAPKLTSWTLTNNRGFASPEALRQAMPFNEEPQVDAGPDLRSDSPTVRLAGKVTDDGRTPGKPLVIRWEVLEGPGAVTFQNAAAAETAATFAAPGDYTLRLVADDGELWRCAMATVHILPAGTRVAAAWEFNRPLDKQGWTEVNPGTKTEDFLFGKYGCKSEPVKYVAGGYYIVAIANSPDAHLLSPSNLGLDLTANQTVRLRLMNHTPATKLRLRFITEADGAWDDRKSATFAVTPNDPAPRVYTVDMAKVPGWTGKLKQLRLDLATGEALTGTVRVDYVWVEGR